MQRAIAATRDAIAQGVPGVLGIHMEGPYLAPARKGTHDDTKFRVPDATEIAMATSLDNGAVSYTHLGVYKRQQPGHTRNEGFSPELVVRGSTAPPRPKA